MKLYFLRFSTLSLVVLALGCQQPSSSSYQEPENVKKELAIEAPTDSIVAAVNSAKPTKERSAEWKGVLNAKRIDDVSAIPDLLFSDALKELPQNGNWHELDIQSAAEKVEKQFVYLPCVGVFREVKRYTLKTGGGVWEGFLVKVRPKAVAGTEISETEHFVRVHRFTEGLSEHTVRGKSAQVNVDIDVTYMTKDGGPDEWLSWILFVGTAHEKYVRSLRAGESEVEFYSYFSTEVDLSPSGIAIKLNPVSTDEDEQQMQFFENWIPLGYTATGMLENDH